MYKAHVKQIANATQGHLKVKLHPRFVHAGMGLKCIGHEKYFLLI